MKHRILVVDDDRATRHLLRKVLLAAGFRVAVASDGSAALKSLRTRRAHLILLDVWMPKMTGLEVLAQLKKRKSKARVIVVTSDDTPATLLKAVRDQAVEYIRKPIQPAALLQIVHRVLKTPASTSPIAILSAKPEWVELEVPCTREAAGRLHEFMTHLDTDLAPEVREAVGYAFRELLLNAVEWGGRLDPSRRVRISYLRARRMVLYRITDPGPGFKLEELSHAAIAHPADRPIDHMTIREEKGLRPGGFGLLMVRAKVDELIYNERRNEVVFVKYLD
ncbi:MAG: response regulator [Acidobacteria bacterium]|nr:response regulator [Acidobacteriota bacterium]